MIKRVLKFFSKRKVRKEEIKPWSVNILSNLEKLAKSEPFMKGFLEVMLEPEDEWQKRNNNIM